MSSSKMAVVASVGVAHQGCLQAIHPLVMLWVLG